MNLHRFDADPDSDLNFHFKADPDPHPDPDWQRNDANPHAVPTLSFTHVGKKEFSFLPFVTALPVNNVLSFPFTPVLFHFILEKYNYFFRVHRQEKMKKPSSLSKYSMHS